VEIVNLAIAFVVTIRADNRLNGFDLCEGQFVALLDSDDVWLREKLEKQLALAEKTGADIIYSSYKIVDSAGQQTRRDYTVMPQADMKCLLRENFIGCSTVLLSRRVVEQYRFEEGFYHEDYVLWLRLLQDGFRAVGCVEPLVEWRLLENSRSFDKRRSAKNRWIIYRKYLKLSVVKSAWYFACYAFSGFKKYVLR
jgi:teichuronic acid biosynthesis glycosyltransferase TuaG